MYKQFWLDELDNSQIKYTGNHMVTNCPICDDIKKRFYVNINNGLWDCKKCQAKGNAWTYLSEYKGMDKHGIIEHLEKYRIDAGYSNKRSKVKQKKPATAKEPINTFDNKVVIENCNRITISQIKEFSEERGLSIDILKKYQLGINKKGEFTLPFYDEKKRLRNIQEREFGPSAKITSLKGGQTVLFGVEDLINEQSGNGDIFIVEGPWSALSLKDRGYKTVGTWNAGNIKESQIELFRGKEVYIIPDNDEAGIFGAEKIKEKLENTARHIHIVEIPVEEKQDIRDFFKNGGSEDHFNYLVKQAILGRLSRYPMPLEGFLKKNIPPVQYYVEDIIQKYGKGMISASPNVGKSIFVQNIVLAIARGATTFMDRFEVSQARVLYLDLEMGEPAMKERFLKMVADRDVEINNLYVKYVPSLDLTQEDSQRMLEDWIEELKIKVLVLDPLGSAWSGNESDQEQVGKLTSYLNTINEIYGISILVIHHWRKSTKEFKTGGQMAAGSYKWSAWLDTHVTLADKSGGILISCEKNRNKQKFSPFLIAIQNDLSLKVLSEMEKKFDIEVIETIFSSFNSEKVSLAEMIRFAKDKMNGGPSGNTLRSLLRKTDDFYTDTRGKSHMIMRVEKQMEFEKE